MRPIMFVLAAALGLAASPALALPDAKPGSIRVSVDGITAGKAVPKSQALCTPNADGKSDKTEEPLRPTIRWSGVPKEAATIAVFMMDPDVPADFTDAGKDGKTLPEDMERMDFFHYGIVGLPTSAEAMSGADAGDAPPRGRELVNDLGLNGYVTPAHAYGGPCPPWNDERVHHYHFIVLALDAKAPVTVPTLRKGEPNAADPNTAKNTFTRLMESGSVLASGTVIGTYTLNPSLLKAD